MDRLYRFNAEGHTLAALSFPSQAAGQLPVVLLHGVTASITFWTQEQAALFAPRGPVTALSLPGHYPAAFPPDFTENDLSAASYARVLAAGVHAVTGGRPALLVGHSTGGFAALALAALAPEVVAGVISISGFAHGRWTGALGFGQHVVRTGSLGRWAFKMTYALNRLTLLGQRASWRVYTPHPQRLFSSQAFAATFESFFANYRRLDLAAMALTFARMPEIDITSDLGSIHVPTLVITGDLDPIVPPAQANLIADRVPDAALAVISGAGHMPHLAYFDVYCDCVTAWLRERRFVREGS